MIIRRELLRAVLPATGPDDRGYALDTIQIRPDGACVATNGHVLLIAREQSPFADKDFPTKDLPTFSGNPAAPILVSQSAVEKLIAAMPKRSTIPILGCVQVTTNGDGAVVSATDLEVPCSVHVAADAPQRFPEYERVIPTERPVLTVHLSVYVLEALIKAAKVLQGGRKSKTGGTIGLQVPIGIQYQAHPFEESPDHCSGKDCPCRHCGSIESAHVKALAGTITSPIGVALQGDGMTVQGVAQPCFPQ